MKIGKLFGIIFAIYIGINFLFNIIVNSITGGFWIFFSNIWKNPLVFIASFFQISLQNSTSSFISLFTGSEYYLFSPNLRIMPPGFSIFNSIAVGMFNSSIFLTILLVIASVFPGLFTTIFTAKKSESKNQAFSIWMLVMIASGIILTILYLINSAEMISFVYFIANYFPNKIAVAVWIFIVEIFIGLFYSVFTVIFFKRKSIENKEIE